MGNTWSGRQGVKGRTTENRTCGIVVKRVRWQMIYWAKARLLKVSETNVRRASCVPESRVNQRREGTYSSQDDGERIRLLDLFDTTATGIIACFFAFSDVAIALYMCVSSLRASWTGASEKMENVTFWKRLRNVLRSVGRRDDANSRLSH